MENKGVQENHGGHRDRSRGRSTTFFAAFLCLLSFFFLSSCIELEKPKPEPFYAQTSPPAKQEFRWSNGKSPKSFDPARASAPPETDIVRALF